MASVKTASHSDRKPLAPSLYSTAFFTIKFKASSWMVNLISSIAKSFSYCLIIAFLGCVNIALKVASSKGFI